jgi:hypothetical protein
MSLGICPDVSKESIPHFFNNLEIVLYVYKIGYEHTILLETVT